MSRHALLNGGREALVMVQVRVGGYSQVHRMTRVCCSLRARKCFLRRWGWHVCRPHVHVVTGFGPAKHLASGRLPRVQRQQQHGTQGRRDTRFGALVDSPKTITPNSPAGPPCPQPAAGPAAAPTFPARAARRVTPAASRTAARPGEPPAAAAVEPPTGPAGPGWGRSAPQSGSPAGWERV